MDEMYIVQIIQHITKKRNCNRFFKVDLKKIEVTKWDHFLLKEMQYFFLIYYLSSFELCREGYRDLNRADTLVVRILQPLEVAVTWRHTAARVSCSFKAKHQVYLSVLRQRWDILSRSLKLDFSKLWRQGLHRRSRCLSCLTFLLIESIYSFNTYYRLTCKLLWILKSLCKILPATYTCAKRNLPIHPWACVELGSITNVQYLYRTELSPNLTSLR